MADEVRFAADLYRETAAAYERCRLPYPAAMTADLVRSAQVSGRGRLLDLACGTGQLAFPLRGWSAEVWAVDQEPNMVDAVRAKAAAAEAWKLRPVVSSAEPLGARLEYFELPVIGNAFHRLDRDLPAGRILGWLQPKEATRRCAGLPCPGPVSKAGSWALAAALDRWKAALGAEQRIPARWGKARSRRPDSEVVTGARFELARSHELAIDHR
jgi:SAM-dependent methyltransferase